MEIDKNIELAFFIEQSKKDLINFCVFTDKFYEVLPHHDLIASNLKDLQDGKIQNLMICMPPRAGKSRIMQEFIAKLYGDNPKTDVLYTGHSLSLLEGFSQNILTRMRGEEFKLLYPETQLQTENIKNWRVKKGGEFAIYGVGGGITGKGGNYLIIDDPYASRADAESETVRRTVSNWYWSTFLSRKQSDKTKQIIIMQRWREDDLIGEILEKEGDRWKVLEIPALNEAGESFWPSRFSPQYFKDLEASQPLFFASQYQQKPFSDGSGDFRKEYFQSYDFDVVTHFLENNEFEIVTFIDPAISQKQEADNTAIITIGLHKRSNNIYLLDVKAGHYSPDELIDKVFETYLEYHPTRVGIEIVQFQKMLALEIRKQMNIRNIYFVLDEILPRGEKEARIRVNLQPSYSSGRVLHGTGEEFRKLEEELLRFPNGRRDDRADALSGAVQMLNTFNITNNFSNRIFAPSYSGCDF